METENDDGSRFGQHGHSFEELAEQVQVRCGFVSRGQQQCCAPASRFMTTIHRMLPQSALLLMYPAEGQRYAHCGLQNQALTCYR